MPLPDEKESPMRVTLSSDTPHGVGSKVTVGGHDLTSHIQRIEIDASCGDITTVTLHAIALDGVDVNIEAGEINIIERAYQVTNPSGPLADSPVRKLLSEIEEAA